MSTLSERLPERLPERYDPLRYASVVCDPPLPQQSPWDRFLQHQNNQKGARVLDEEIVNNDDRAAHVCRIAALVKAMRGDIIGDYVTTGCITCNMGAVQRIDCRVPPETYAAFVHVLRLDYAVIEDPATPASLEDDPWTGRFRVVINRPPPLALLNLNVLSTSSRCNWRTHNLHFDSDLVAVDGDRVYVRFHTLAMRTLPDRLSFCMNRIRNKRFSLIDAPETQRLMAASSSSSEPDTTTTHVSRAVRRAAAMLADGWRMDDALLGRGAWVVAQWDVLPHARTATPQANLELSIRRGPAAAAQHAQCPLCQEPFQGRDVVLNLRCNHNFHVCCPRGALPGPPPPASASLPGGPGICTWLESHSTCPCCREPVA